MDNKKENRVAINLGGVFPRDCETKQEDNGMGSCYPIYLKLFDLYQEKEIDLQDFVSIRRALSIIPIAEFSIYADFVSMLLCLNDKQKILTQIEKYDEKYQCRLFEKREKRVERDPASNQIVQQTFCYVNRPVEFGDVVRIAKAIVGKMAAFPREFIDSNFITPPSSEDNVQVAKKNLEICDALLSSRELVEEIMEKVYGWFDTTFQEFQCDPRFTSFFEKRRGELYSSVISSIYTKKGNSFRIIDYRKNLSQNCHVSDRTLHFYKRHRSDGKLYHDTVTKYFRR